MQRLVTELAQILALSDHTSSAADLEQITLPLSSCLLTEKTKKIQCPLDGIVLRIRKENVSRALCTAWQKQVLNKYVYQNKNSITHVIHGF